MATLLLCAAGVYAQKSVSGTVIEDDGTPLIGASVLIKGTSSGTVTDLDGNFTISVPSDDATLVVSYTGYLTQEVTLSGETSIKIVLETGVGLDEIVVTGYSVGNKRSTTGAVSTIKSRDLTAVPSGNVEQQLQGRAPGVTVITNGQPGTSSIVRVRGFGAFGGNEPLYVVDGVPTGSTEFLAPDDIESTTVLKDAASASIYGARAANGVIVFTTKKGKKKPQPLTISYDGQVGVTTPGSGQELLTPQEQADWTWQAIRNTARANGTTPTFEHPQYGNGDSPVLPDYINVGGASGVNGTVDLNAEAENYNIDPRVGPIYQVVRANKEGTDWYDATTRNAFLTRHQLGFSGATESARYYVSLGMQDQEGILLSNSFKRRNFRVNTEFDLAPWLRIGENIQLTYRSALGIGGGNGGRGVNSDENDILSAFRMPPIIPVYDEFGGYAGTAAKGFNNPRNPVASRDGQDDNQAYAINTFGNVYVELDLFKDLTLRSSFGGQYQSFFLKSFTRLQYENSENNASFGYAENNGYNAAYVFSNTAKYKKQFGVHGIEVLAGIEALNTGAGLNLSASGINPFSTNVDYINLSTVNSTVVNSNKFKGVNFYSLFGSVNYNYNEKYYLTGVIRRDGSSRFGANNRYGVFPAFSAAWRVTGESFLQESNFVTDLKIRGGWGQMGNSNNVNPNNQYTLYASNLDNASYDIAGSNTGAQTGFYQSRIGNPNAKWETSTTTNIGIDGSFLRGHFDVVFDLWEKKTEDLLFQVPLPAVIGTYAEAPSVNIASMVNRGLDLQLIYRNTTESGLGYEFNITGSWLQNEITALAPNVDFFETQTPTNRLSTQMIRNAVGQPISSFYGYEVIGLFQNDQEVANAPDQDGAAPGRFRYADLNGFDDNGELTGVPDGKIDAADRTFIGSPVPKFLGGLNIKVSYRGFELETYLYTSLGNKIFNMSKWYTDFYPSFTGAAVSARVKDSWLPDNTNTDVPVFEDASNFSTNTQANSYYVEDGSYLRMQNLTLAYNLPSTLFNGRFERARVFVATNNVFTITKYSGLDPAVGGAVDTTLGIDIGNYPVTRSYTFGVGLTF